MDHCSRRKIFNPVNQQLSCLFHHQVGIFLDFQLSKRFSVSVYDHSFGICELKAIFLRVLLVLMKGIFLGCTGKDALGAGLFSHLGMLKPFLHHNWSHIPQKSICNLSGDKPEMLFPFLHVCLVVVPFPILLKEILIETINIPFIFLFCEPGTGNTK